MSDSFFYSQITSNGTNGKFLADWERYAKGSLQQIYIITQPLSERKYDYNFQDGLVILCPKYKILVVNFGDDDDAFEDYFEDFIEDLGYISDKYGYKKILGRPRSWKELFFTSLNYRDIENMTPKEILDQNSLTTKESERNGEFIISLLTGSINDVSRIGGEFPETILEKIKKKIILFDGDQTKFIYQEPYQKRITIQGLAGTGKTELLLHKLKDLYTKESDSRIVFTCHNKILAESLRIRIPDFFNFMKVEEQIVWNERLWTISSWGSEGSMHSGVYSYICNYYNLPFRRYSYLNSFAKVCQNALDQLNEIENFEPCFTYILIDESQDFPEEFFKLCEKVTKKAVYIAGDIFQNIFDDVTVSKVNPDFLLNKCYRTDPRTLMFAHGIGMGLFDRVLRWLSDDEWEACGYIVKKNGKKYNLHREPLRRFEDIEAEGIESVKIIATENQKYESEIMLIIEDIVDKNPTVVPDDIGIIFLENVNSNYQLASTLQVLIKQRFGWNVNIGYETKTKKKNTLFISNRNNVKGLEFPFVIFITQSILNEDLQKRNSIYMMLTRSFLTTYFLVSSRNGELIRKLESGLDEINKKGYLSVTEPTATEKEALRNAIINKPQKEQKSHYDVVEGIMDEINVKKEFREDLHKVVEALCKDDFDQDRIFEIIRTNYNLIGFKDN
jgi:superfamily I DNA and RNA helicase